MALDYTTLITSQHRSRPKFSAWLTTIAGSIGDITDVLAEMNEKFDVDTAVGAQLDVVGLWVGCSRYVVVPINNWFSFDTPGKGFDEGFWRGSFDPGTGLYLLDDVSYRRIIRAVIAADHWDGTLKNYHAVLQKAMPSGNTIWAVDNFDMSIDIHVSGPKLNAVMTALLTTGKLSEIKPAGVAIAAYILPT